MIRKYYDLDLTDNPAPGYGGGERGRRDEYRRQLSQEAANREGNSFEKWLAFKKEYYAGMSLTEYGQGGFDLFQQVIEQYESSKASQEAKPSPVLRALEKLSQRLKDKSNCKYNVSSEGGRYWAGMAEGIDEARREIEEILSQSPTVDAVEPVKLNDDDQGEMISEIGTLYTEYGFKDQDWDDFVKEVTEKYTIHRIPPSPSAPLHKEAVEANQPAGGVDWIKTGDKDPDIGHLVLCFIEYVYRGKDTTVMMVGYLGENGELFYDNDEEYGWQFRECVTYWAELPAKPIEKTAPSPSDKPVEGVKDVPDIRVGDISSRHENQPVKEEEKCVAGCKTFTGGEKKHHKDCPFYPQSLTRIYEGLAAALAAEKEANAKLREAGHSAGEQYRLELEEVKAERDEYKAALEFIRLHGREAVPGGIEYTKHGKRAADALNKFTNNKDSKDEKGDQAGNI